MVSPAGGSKVALVTGANSGIGLETSRALASRGLTVVMAARSRERGAAAVEDVRRSTGSDAVHLLELDLANLASVRAAVDAVRSRWPELKVLVANAGLVQARRSVTADGFETTFGVNHLGHHAFVLPLVKALRAAAPARLVVVSSEAHRFVRTIDFQDLMGERRYSQWRAYGQSKLANALFALELHRRLQGTGVDVYAVEPGAVATGFARDGDGTALMGWLMGVARFVIQTPVQGARTVVHCATAPEVAGVSGQYWGRMRVRRPTAAAVDVALARRLWDVSEQLTGVRWEG